MKKVILALFFGAVSFVFNSRVLAAENVVVIPLMKTQPTSTSKLLFVTNGTWAGNLGRLEGADAKCNAEAKQRGIQGQFQALLGSTEGRPESRSIHYPVPYLRFEDGEDLNSDYHDLFNSGLNNAVTLSANKFPWTGLQGDGRISLNDCNGWSASSGASTGTNGWTHAYSSPQWLNLGSSNCDILRPIYCIEQ